MALMPKRPLNIFKFFQNETLQIEGQRLFYWTPVPLALGIAAYFLCPNEPDVIVVLAVLAAALILAMLARGSITARIVLLIVVGFAASSVATHMYGTPMLSGRGLASRVEAVIADVERHKSGRRILLENPVIEKLSPDETPRRIRLVIPRRLDRQAGELKPGQRFRGVARITPLSEPMVPGGFDFRRNSYFHGIGASGYALGKIEIAEPEKPENKAGLWFAALRQNLQAEIKKNLQGDKAGLAAILLTGDKTLLSEDTAAAMRGIGLAHLLAIAGLHIGLVAGFIFFFIRALLALIPGIALRLPIKKIAAFFALAAIAFYTLQVGAPVPTRRALVMTGIVLLAIILDRISLSIRSIVLAALVLLVIWPHMLFHPSFQLSFAAVLGLISVGEAFRKRHVHEKRGIVKRVAHHFGALAGMSVVAMIATLPLCLYHFQEAEVYSVLANTLAIPLTGFWLMPLSLAAEALWPLGLADWPMRLLDPGLGLLIDLSHAIANLPGAHYTPPPMPVAYLMMAVFGGLFFCLTTGRKRAVGLVALLLAVGLTFLEPRPDIFISPDGLQTGWYDKEKKELLIAAEDKPDKFMAAQWAEKIGLKEENIRYLDWEGKIKPVKSPSPLAGEEAKTRAYLRREDENQTEESASKTMFLQVRGQSQKEQDGQKEDERKNEISRMISCAPARCIAQTPAGAIAWIMDTSIIPQECEKGRALIISPLTNETCPESKTKILTRESFYDHGAHAIVTSPTGLDIITARLAHSRRPWTSNCFLSF